MPRGVGRLLQHTDAPIGQVEELHGGSLHLHVVERIADRLTDLLRLQNLRVRHATPAKALELMQEPFAVAALHDLVKSTQRSSSSLGASAHSALSSKSEHVQHS